MRALKIPLPHLNLAALQIGPEDHPAHTLLAFHGWLDNAASFEPLALILHQHRPDLRIIALDLPGHGASDWRPPGSPHHFLDWIPDVAAAADALGLDRFSLLGHSMGAGIAALTAAALPQRVTSLALIEGLGPLSDDPDSSPEQLRRALAQRARTPSPPAVFPDLDAATQRRLQAGSPMRYDSALRLTQRQLATNPHGEGLIFRSDPALRRTSLGRLTEPQVLAFLRAVQAPTLLLSAQQGWPFNPDTTHARLQALPSLEHHTLPGGHHLHLDAPHSVAPHLLRFWTQHLPSDPTP
jgi:pimeloyl-ACP methyl ester carboxylesterase